MTISFRKYLDLGIPDISREIQAIHEKSLLEQHEGFNKPMHISVYGSESVNATQKDPFLILVKRIQIFSKPDLLTSFGK